MLKPGKVFTPNKIPVKPGNTYASRGKTQEDLEKAIDRGFIPLIFGDYGVGKTSMARHVLKPYEEAGRLVNIESISGKTIQDIFQYCLEKMNFTVTRSISKENTNNSSSNRGGEASANIGWLSAKLSSNKQSGNSEKTTTVTEFAVSSPTDSKLIEMCEDFGLVLMIDELHKASEQCAKDLVEFIKTCGNASVEEFKIILLGTSSDSSRLVAKDPGVDRLIEDIKLSSMNDAECINLITSGMKSLCIEIEEPAYEKLVKSCVGAPNILQYLCLVSAENAFVRTPRKLTAQDVDQAISEYVEKKVARLNHLYLQAVETTGPKRYRKQILIAMSQANDEYVTMDELVKIIQKTIPEARNTDISGPLKRLKEDDYGPVLRDVMRTASDQRIQNYTAFVDPAMKAFIRMQVAKD